MNAPTPNPSTGRFSLSWSASSTATYYTLEEQFNGGNWIGVLDNGQTIHGTSITLDRGNGSYEYHVKACLVTAQTRCSAASNGVTETVSGSVTPPTPASISSSLTGCVNANTASFTISWAQSNNATSYEVRETNPDPGTTQPPIPPVSGTSVRLTRNRPSGLSSTIYAYEVRACAAGGSACSPYRGTAYACIGNQNAVNAPGVGASSMAYDAFGTVRNGDYSDRAGGVLNLLPDTLRGFTGHQHVDDVRLIHMNGRVYDYALGRFLSVDPVIQFPSNTQSLNSYSYILNNPLSGTDPTGYQNLVDPDVLKKGQIDWDARSIGHGVTLGVQTIDLGQMKNGADEGTGPKGSPSEIGFGSSADIGASATSISGNGEVPARPRDEDAVGLDGFKVTPEGAEPLEYRVAYYQFILPNYLQQRAIWDDQYATAKSNHDAMAIGKMFMVDPAIGALGGMVAGKAIASGVAAYRAANAARGAVGFADDAVASAYQGMRSGGGHAMRHLMDEGLIANAGSLASPGQTFERLTSPILTNPTAAFNWTVGNTAARGFAGQVSGRPVVVFVAREGAYQGRVISAIVPDAAQIAQWGL